MWFAAIVANAARQRLRAERCRQRREQAQARPPDEPALPQAPPAAAEEALQALASLAEQERLAVWLHLAEGISCRAIAHSLQVREGTIRSRVCRGLARLRTRLGVDRADALRAVLGAGTGAPAPATLATHLALAAGTITPPAALSLGALAAAVLLAITAVVGAGIVTAVHRRTAPPPPRTGAVGSDAPPAPATDAPATASDRPDPLDAMVQVHLWHRPLAECMAALEQALPVGRQFPWVISRRVDLPWAGATCTTPGPTPIRAVLDTVAGQLGLRWQDAAGAILFSRPLPAAARQRLVAQLHAPDAIVREAAAQALAWSGDLDAQRAILLACGDADEAVATTAVEAGLAQIGPVLPDPVRPTRATWAAAWRGDAGVAAALARRFAADRRADRPEDLVLETLAALDVRSEDHRVIDLLATTTGSVLEGHNAWSYPCLELLAAHADDAAAALLAASTNRWRLRAFRLARHPRLQATCRALLQDRSAAIDDRQEAAIALAAAQGADRAAATQAWMRILVSPTEPFQVRAMCATTLAACPDPASADILLQTLHAEERRAQHDGVRETLVRADLTATIITALVGTRDARVAPVLLDRLEHHDHVPMAVLRACLDGLATLQDPQVAPRLARLVPSPSNDLGWGCDAVFVARALGGLGTDAALQLLWRCLATAEASQQGEIAREVWYGLTASHRPEVSARLLADLHDPSPSVRDNAVRFASETQDPLVLAAAYAAVPLQEFVRDVGEFNLSQLDAALRVQIVAQGLAGHGDAHGRGASALLTCMAQSVCLLAADDRDRLLHLLATDPDPLVRIRLLTDLPWDPRLGYDGCGRIIGAVLDPLAHDPDASVRQAAAEACGMALDVNSACWSWHLTIPALITAVADPDPGVRAAVRTQLSWYRQRPEVAAALAHLPVPHPSAGSGPRGPAAPGF